MSTSTASRSESAQARAWPDVAGAVRSGQKAILALWEELGTEGPTFGQQIDVDEEAVRHGYLRPLSLMLERALSGSAVHVAAYLEARVAYLPKALDGEQRAQMFTARLGRETARMAHIFENTVSPPRTRAALDALHEPLTRPPDADDPRVLLVGDCLMSGVRCFLIGRYAARTGRMLDSDHFFFSSGVEPLEPEAVRRSIAQAPPALIGLSMFSFGGVPAYAALLGRSRGVKGPDHAAVESLVAMLASSIEAIRAVTDATILVHGSCGLPLGPRLLRHRWVPAQRPGRTKLIAAINSQVAELVDATENTIMVDENAIVAANGGLRALGAPVLGPGFEAAYAHHSLFGDVLADVYERTLTAHTLLGEAKVLLVDFDNTLWEGVMADGPVSHYRDRQLQLKRLREAGVLLVALSKNDPGSIRWDELALDREDFVLHQINWRPKPDNVSDAITALDLAPRAFVLLDDNPVERALVCENVPGVRALDATDPLADDALADWLEFPSTRQTPEARRRTEMYRESAERRRALGGREHDYDQMMRSLDLVADVRTADDSDGERLLELIQRTSQFNTTTRRRSPAEIDHLLADPSTGVHVASLKDRFGDLGVVAVAILRHHTEVIEIDSFIMSCRAMGFGLERYLLADVLTATNGQTVDAPFVPTDRNGPAASLYPSCGFTETSPGQWRLGPNDARPQAPDWFTQGARAGA